MLARSATKARPPVQTTLGRARPRLPEHSGETVFVLVCCVTALIAGNILLPKHSPQPVEDQPVANTPISPTSVAAVPLPVSASPATQLTPMAEQLPAPEVQVTPEAAHSAPTPEQGLVNEQPADAPAPVAAPAPHEAVASPVLSAPAQEPPPADPVQQVPADPLQQALSPLLSAIP